VVRCAWLIVAFVASCERPPATSTAVAPPHVPSRCDPAYQRTLSTIRSAKLDAEDAARVVTQFDRCWDGWSIALDVLCRVPETRSGATVVGRWVVMYTALDGSTATYRRPGDAALALCGRTGEVGNIAAPHLGGLVELEPPVLFDFDGDGVPEIWFADQHIRELLAFKNKVASRYPPALRLRGVPLWGVQSVADVDHDRRPDLLLAFDRAVPPPVPERVAHALPDGTFSEDDAIARRELIAQCPATESLLVLRTDDTVDVDASIAAISCAALRGELGRDISRRLATLCNERDDCHEVERWGNDMYLYGVGKP
jgi:hypothetical protein